MRWDCAAQNLVMMVRSVFFYWSGATFFSLSRKLSPEMSDYFGMASPPKIFNRGNVLFITTSVEEGLLLLANPLMEAILLSCLARAQKLHPVRICDFIFEATHVHLLLIIDNPDDVHGFMRRFKTESAHAINRLLGRNKHTVWCESYDAPQELTALDVQNRLIYLYSNPVKDNLETTIEKYPGLSSWQAFSSKVKTSVASPWIRRPTIKALPKNSSPSVLKKYAARLKQSAPSDHLFTVYPMAWTEAFGMTESDSDSCYKAIIDGIRDVESQCGRARAQSGRSVIGSYRLSRQNFDLSYLPNRTGRRMWCHSHDRQLRKIFIRHWKGVKSLAREVFQRWKLGDYTLPFPAGLFPPSMPKLLHLIPT